MIRSAALAVALSIAGLPALAQTAPAAAKPANTAQKPAQKSAPKPAPKPRKAAAAKPLAAATPEQLQAAQMTHFGTYQCDFKQTIDVGMNPKTPGYVDVKFKKKTYVMKPVLSSTGALRLEDVTGRTLLIQIANKSMLMDTKIGQRLVDDCVHEHQLEASRRAKESQQ